MLVMVILLGSTLCVSASTAEDAGLEAYRAYYEYLNAEIAGIGQPVRDEDFYNMYTDEELRPAIMEKLLHTYLADVTNDGIEELIIKRLVTYKYKKFPEDSITFSSEREWICVYSYIDGKLERIGQNLYWYKNVGEDRWASYQPDGFIGVIPSLSSIPSYPDQYLTLCFGNDGKAFLCDGDVSAMSDDFTTMYSFNGTHMAEDTMFQRVFIPDWSVGDIHSQYGSYSYNLNNESVAANVYLARLKECTGGGTYKLINNDYREVLNVLSEKLEGKDVPYGNANPHFHTPSEWIAQNNQHYRTCQSGCDVKLDLSDCGGGDATCFEKAICSVCQKPYGELEEHALSKNYSSENGKHFITCRNRGCTEIFDEGDCVDSDRDHWCDVCDESVGTHKAVEGTHTCDYCGKNATYCADCDSNRDHICDICGGQSRVHAAAKGEHVCSYCGEKVSECADNNKDRLCDVCREDYNDGNSFGTTAALALVAVAIIAVIGTVVSRFRKKR